MWASNRPFSFIMELLRKESGPKRLLHFNLTISFSYAIIYPESEVTAMSKKKKTIPPISTYEVIRKQHRDWGEINPICRRIENKKKNHKEKHKGKEFDNYD